MKLRYPITASILFVLGIYSHMSWVYVHGIMAQVEACEKINCTEVAWIAGDIEKYQLPAIKLQQKKGVN